MSEFTPTEKLTIEEQKKLPASDQKEYILWRMKQDGEEVPTLDDHYIIPTLGVDEQDSPGALPPRAEVTQALPNTQSEDDNSDLPASMKGELGSLDEENPVIPTVKGSETEEVLATEEVTPPPGQETAPDETDTEGTGGEKPTTEETPSEPFIKVNEQTTYNTQEDAIKGINEKDRTIQVRDEELRIARQDAELAVREAESLRRRFEAEVTAEETPPPIVETPTAELPAAPTAQQLYDIYDDPEQGPMEAVRKMMPHVIQDLQPLIDMAQRLKALNADEFIKQLQLMKTADVMQSYHEESIYGNVDAEYPEFEGKWRDPKDPIGLEYARIWKSIDQSYVRIHGATLSDISERSPESVQWAISEVLSRMTAPSENGVTTPPPATTEPVTTPPEPPPTEGTDQGEHKPLLTQEEATKLAKETAELAVDAVNTRNKIHGQTQTETSGARTTQPATTKKEWTKEEIRKNPKGFANYARNNPAYRDATLDLLPQVRE